MRWALAVILGVVIAGSGAGRAGAARAVFARDAKTILILRHHGLFVPNAITVADGNVLEFCNEDPYFNSEVTFNPYNKFAVEKNKPGKPYSATGAQPPGTCTHMTVHNPTAQNLTFGIGDDIHSQAILHVTVLPNPNTTGEPTALSPKASSTSCTAPASAAGANTVLILRCHGLFVPNSVVVKDGAVLEFCNEDPYFNSEVTFNPYNKFAVEKNKPGKPYSATGARPPGTCTQMTAHNPTAKNLTFAIGDDIHSRAILHVTVLASANPTVTPTPTPATTTNATPAMPTSFTLKVDGTTVTDTLATGKYTDSGGVVVNTYYSVPTAMKAGDTLSATATANAPLPPGWSITIITYSGTICDTKTTTCGPATATFPDGANAGMGITAQLNTTTGYYSASINAWAVLPTTGG
jgi:hypothetical protein